MSKAYEDQFALQDFLINRRQDCGQYHFNGKSYTTLTELIEDNKLAELSCALVNRRIKSGIPIREALHTPRCVGEFTHPKRCKHHYGGKCYSSYKAMIIDNMHDSLSYSAVYTRLRNGWSLDKALKSPKLEIFNNLNGAKQPPPE
ncbi:hypothetical protein [Vibrio sp. THAF190c]|uniref:hypothetical protein n=1 Tax=Vibrio sp. THAF190c TaxID=2587865 RepID=UPI001268AE14|nr:hypothetical protein [Vibrio sp. THAF190c]